MLKPHAASVALGLLASRQERTVTRNATEARQSFFQLLGAVVADSAQVVVIEHKDLKGHGALVGEGFLTYVRALEAVTRDLAQASTEPFTLLGTATAHGDVAGMLQELRSDDEASRTARRAGVNRARQ